MRTGAAQTPPARAGAGSRAGSDERTNESPVRRLKQEAYARPTDQRGEGRAGGREEGRRLGRTAQIGRRQGCRSGNDQEPETRNKKAQERTSSSKGNFPPPVTGNTFCNCASTVALCWSRTCVRRGVSRACRASERRQPSKSQVRVQDGSRALYTAKLENAQTHLTLQIPQPQRFERFVSINERVRDVVCAGRGAYEDLCDRALARDKAVGMARGEERKRGREAGGGKFWEGREAGSGKCS